jgi:predicted alpha/beta hydrolase family esterase
MPLKPVVEAHWQTHLAGRLAKVRVVPPMGRANLVCTVRVEAIEYALSLIDGPVAVAAHSVGCVVMAHWAGVTRQAHRVVACLLATPPDFDRPMPAGGWLPVPRARPPFCSLVAASRNDPLGLL